jgi:signal transduction histidine kinase
MLRERGDLALAAAATVQVPGMSRNRMEQFTRIDLDLGSAGPLGYTIERNETLVVPDIDDDPRFPGWSTPWAEALRSIGCRSLVMVPLRLGGDVIGTLSAAFTWRGALDRADLTFLEEYAERASSVIVRARAYERERAASAQLAAADRQKSEFLAMVSHELRTPLTAVKGFVDTVLLHWDRLSEERRRELLTRASGNADELARLVGQLLDFARVEADRVEVSPEPMATAEAIGGVLRDLAPVVDDHRVELDVEPGLMMLADPDAFSRVLVNLLTNAVKFSAPGSRVAIEAVREGDDVVVSVADEGVGIAPEDRARIFDRFYQSADTELSRRGTGIGLAIARRFTELQGGRIWVESEPGRGSTFSFTVPVATAIQRPA